MMYTPHLCFVSIEARHGSKNVKEIYQFPIWKNDVNEQWKKWENIKTELKPWKCQFFLGLSCFGTRQDVRQEESEIHKSKKKI